MVELLTVLLVVALLGTGWRLLRSRGSVTSDASPRQKVRANRVSPTSALPAVDTFHWPGTGAFEFEVVGESFYQRDLAQLAGQHGERSVEVPCVAKLVLEDDNKHDAKAVAVLVNGRKVGHLSREDARSYRRRLGAKKLSGECATCDAFIVGGGTRRNGEKLMYGVKLDIKPFE